MLANEQSLDRVGQDVLAFVRKAKPELLPHASVVAGEEGFALVLSIPAPNPKPKYPLCITTENEELTWFFGGWHGHYEADTEAQIAEVFAQIDDVFRDRVLALAYARDGKWAGGTLAKTREQIFTGYFEGFPGSVEVRSWTGSRDEDIPESDSSPRPPA